ncbi:hypothetical protein [Amycolatopsis antarctica]|nr:hypothetical protein [Amycolatopsis antarctica]
MIDDDTPPCQVCHGAKIQHVHYRVHGRTIHTTRTCPHCHGTGLEPI